MSAHLALEHPLAFAGLKIKSTQFVQRNLDARPAQKRYCLVRVLQPAYRHYFVYGTLIIRPTSNFQPLIPTRMDRTIIYSTHPSLPRKHHECRIERHR